MLLDRCGLVQTAHGALLSASYYNQPGICIEKAKWLWDRVRYTDSMIIQTSSFTHAKLDGKNLFSVYM